MTDHTVKRVRGLQVRRTALLTLTGVAAGVAAMMCASSIALATQSANTSGTNDTYGTTKAYQVARTNSYPQNSAAWQMNSCNHDYGGGYFVAALRNSSGNTFARTGNITNCPSASRGFVPDSGTYLPAGTFYVNTGIYAGACGGSGCPNVAWTATITWDIRS